MYYHDIVTDKVMTWRPPVPFDGYTTKPCNRRRCTTCKYIHSCNYTYSYTTRKKYITSLCVRQGNCRTSGIVYAISCKKCEGCIYVGMTTRDLAKRFMEHRNCVITRKNQHLPLYSHFSSDNHTSEDMQIQIIYKSTKESKDDISQDLLINELLWTKILNTAYPFGCNDNIRGYGNITEEQNFERKKNHPYFQYPCPRKPRSHGRRKRAKRNSQLEVNSVNTAYDTLTDDSIGIRTLFLYLRALPKITIRKLLNTAMANKSSVGHLRLLTIYYVVAATIPRKTQSANLAKPYRWCVSFPNKAMEYIRLETILKDRTLYRSLPAIPSRKISVTFTYNKPNKLSLCNYNTVLREMTKESLKSILKQPCDCATSSYIYPTFEHILTGDLKVIHDERLRKIFANGSKYRLAVPIDWNDTDKAFNSALPILIKWMSKDTKLPMERFKEYQNRFTQLYQSRKEYIIRTQDTEEYDYIDKMALQQLHNKFVITVVDKAPNNLVIMCKKLFLITLCKELGIKYDTWEVTGNTVYHPTNADAEKIIETQKGFAIKYNLAIDDKGSLASIYPIPKLHKNPYKFRFIASSRKSAMKPISKLLDSILGFIKIHFRNITRKILQRSGINPWWSIDSTYDFLDICNKLQNKQLNGKYLFTGDFSDMFTSCKHDTMRKNLCSIINMCFKNSCCTYIKIDNGKVSYTNESNTRKLIFRKEELYEMIDFILDNNYVTFAGFTFKQIKGVPMGLPSAPKMIDLTMSFCEYKFMTNKANEAISRLIGNNTCRYVDDFFTCTEFDITTVIHEIYPNELTLNQTSTPYQTTFLDTSIQLLDNKMYVSVYNKTDDFPFTVIKYNHPKSNVHSSTGYNTFYGEMLRFGRICCTYDNFLKRCRVLFHDFSKLGYEQNRIVSTIYKFAKNNSDLLVKFNLVDHTDIIQFANVITD